MPFRKAICFLLFAFYGCFSSPVDAQINLKTGYNFSIVSGEGFNQVISTFNDLQSYSEPFDNLKWLHGFETGLRFKSDVHAIEVTYQGGYQTLKATGQNVDQTFNDKIRFAIHSAAIGYQASAGIFGLGTDLQYQFYKVKVTSSQKGKFKNVQDMPALKFYLMFTLEGSKGVDMALQPYYVHPFKQYDLIPLKNFLIEGGTNPGEEKWSRFGLTILFYNGSK